MFRSMSMLLMVAAAMVLSPCTSDPTPDPEVVRVVLDLGHADSSAPADPFGGVVSYDLEVAAATFTVRGTWPDASVLMGVEAFTALASHDGMTTTYTLPAEVAGASVVLNIPWDLPAIFQAPDAVYGSGGWFVMDDVATTVTWPDYCGAVWPCPADDYIRVVWDVVAPDGSGGGYWLAEDSRGTATDPFHVSWAWYEVGARLTTHEGYIAIGRPEVVPLLAEDLDNQDPYIDEALRLMGDRPITEYGSVDAGDWGTAPDYAEMGAMEHQPYEFVDSAQGPSYPSLLPHEYLHSWYSAKIGYPHVGEMVVGEGIVTYLEGIVTANVDGGGLQSWISAKCRGAWYGAQASAYPAWVPDGANIYPPDLFGAALPYSAGSLLFYDYSADVLGDPAALAPVLAEIAADLPEGAYSLQDIMNEVEVRTGVPMGPWTAWVTTTGRELGDLASACDI